MSAAREELDASAETRQRLLDRSRRRAYPIYFHPAFSERSAVVRRTCWRIRFRGDAEGALEELGAAGVKKQSPWSMRHKKGQRVSSIPISGSYAVPIRESSE